MKLGSYRNVEVKMLERHLSSISNLSPTYRGIIIKSYYYYSRYHEDSNYKLSHKREWNTEKLSASTSDWDADALYFSVFHERG